ncbi:MAG: hypothetical protein K6U80_09620 [Firmicutes bacterium]|nr:hypothetical protein [Bacillota bacterium]
MKKFFILILALTMILVFSTAAWGVSFGARAAGMGGAFTAVADDCSAVYWNPAGITQLKVLTITPGVGFQGIEEQIRAYLNILENKDFNSVLELLDSFGDDGLYIGGSVYLGLTTKFIAVNAFGDANIIMKQDDIFNKSYTDINLYGIGTIAIPIGRVAYGGNVKLVGSNLNQSVIPIITEYNWEYILNNWDDYDELLTNPDYNYSKEATGQGVAFDVGVLACLTDSLKLGITGRNIVSSVEYTGKIVKYTFNNDPLNPGFEEYSSEDISGKIPLVSTYSVGLAWRPGSSTLIATDVEMIINPLDPDLNMTLFHVGLEQLLLAKLIALRAGAFTNPDNSVNFSAGLGFKLGPVLFDVAATQAGKATGVFLTAGFKF